MGRRLSSGTFVGRKVELDRLNAMLDALDDAGATTVLIGGDAGIGKSRLVEQFCDGAQQRGVLVASGACTPTDGGGLPYGPVVGMLRDAARQLRASDVDAVLGPARHLLGLASARDGLDTPVTGDLGKTQLFEALLTSVVRLAEKSPVVLVFEDLQWADSASVEVVDFLTRNLADRPVLIIATYRGDEVERDRPLRRTLLFISKKTASVHVSNLLRILDAVSRVDAAEIGQRAGLS